MTPEDQTALIARSKIWGIDQAITGSVGFLVGLGEVKALLEYCRDGCPEADAPIPEASAIAHLSWPIFVAYHTADFADWRVVACNAEARVFIPEPITMNEEAWIRLLHRLRDVPEAN